MPKRKPSSSELERGAALDEGLSVRKERPRHDEGAIPRGHELDADRWPQRKDRRELVTVNDRALVRATIDIMTRQLLSETEGPTYEIDARAKIAYVGELFEALSGNGPRESREDGVRRLLTQTLAGLLRLREEARVHTRVSEHRGRERSEKAARVATTGAAIVSELDGGYAPCVAWLDVDDRRKRLATAIDALDGAINLGGAGGRNRGQTPETLADTLIVALADPRAARAAIERRKRRRRASP